MKVTRTFSVLIFCAHFTRQVHSIVWLLLCVINGYDNFYTVNVMLSMLGV